MRTHYIVIDYWIRCASVKHMYMLGIQRI
jgi:hypothetical protein